MKLSSITSALRLALCAAVLSAYDALAIDTYDVVIVGSGPGGLVAAEFLSRDPSIKVLVLEAGGPSLQATGGTDVPAYAKSKGFTKFDIPGEYGDGGSGSIFNNENAKYRVDWISDEQSYLGKLVGGCSSINAALYFRAPDSYVTNTKWPFSPARMNAGFDAIEQMFGHTDSPSPDGKRYLQEAHDIVAKAFKEQGKYAEVTLNDEAARNSKDKTFGHAPFAFKNGLRDSPAKVFYGAFKDRPNAKLVTYATVSYIKQTRGRATGVVYNDNVEVALSTRGAVIMAAGAMSTPKVLIQSGIGPKSQLELLRKRTDFPGVLQSNATGGWVYNENVGKNLFDTNTVFPSFSHPQMRAVLGRTSQQWATDQYMNNGQSGVLSTSGPVLIAYENYDVNGRAYEFQTTVNPYGFGEFASNSNAFFLALYINNPESRDYSSFNADGKWIGFTQKTVIMSSNNDIAAMKTYTKKVVNMLTASGAKFLSGNAGESIDSWVDRNKNWKTNHFGGSCYTSSDVSDTKRCADEKLRVVGTSNIFVSDASLQKEGTVNPYGFIMYAGYEAGNVVKDYISQGPPKAQQCSATLEQNVDYAGLDIDSGASATPEGCCSKCEALNGCQAFTWTNYNGGTCWFKSAKGAASASSGAVSGVVSITPDSTPSCPTIQQDLDFAGNDIGDALAPTAEGCCVICKARAGCNAFTWNDYRGGTCWLKSGKGSASYKQGARSAVMGDVATPAPASCPTIEEGVDYVGNDVGSATSTTAEGCCSICRSTTGCRAFSWNDYNGGTCWLKSGKGATALKQGALSAEITSSCAAIQENVDLSGSDLANSPATKAELCCAICRATNGCKAFTWTSYSGGTCWLKSAVGAASSTAGARSAVLL